MASSSTQKAFSSSSTPKPNFDVFLSFRGEDTRYGFTDHLFKSLTGRGIHTFRDDKLQRGGEIDQELLETIEGSRFSIIVFSERYADSKWCLEELTKIMDCKKERGQTVLPVFYHVDPSDVRKQTGSFGKGFEKHETAVDGEKVERWRAAMTEATNLGGWHVVKDKEYETKPIKEIIDFILKRLKPKFLHVEEHMVGMKSRLENLKSMLQIHLGESYVIGICGISGIGKTTIAKMLYNDILCLFDGSCFLEDVKNRFKSHNDKLQLVQELLRGIQKDGNLELNSISDGVDMIKDRLNSGKFLIVVDDVDHQDQAQLLIKSCTWFAPGTRIIVTTKDKRLLNMHQLEASTEVNVLLYEASALCEEESIELFCWHAFKQDVPKEDYMDLSKCMINYAQGHPLALKVLGSSLCGRTIDEWKSELDKLKKCPQKEVNNLFRVSFDGLDYFEKEVFLDIACFFNGTDKDFVLRILDNCNLYATGVVPILCNRCLITIVDNKVQMHGLVQQMGWAVMREEYPRDPSKWSRLWDPNDIHNAFSAKKIKNIETISLDLCGFKEMQFTSEVFAKMKNKFAKMKKLRLLKVYYSLTLKEDKIRLPIDFEFPPNLRYLHWEGLEFLPSNLAGQNLVALNLKSSNIKELWEGDKDLPHLKFIDLSDSQQLMKIPKFSTMPNLEILDLGGCTNFYELHPSIDASPKMKFLKVLNFRGSRIKELPSSIGSLTCLEILDLSFCAMFEKLPDIFEDMGHLRMLNLCQTRIKELPDSIGRLESLESLGLMSCSKLEKLPEMDGSVKCLKELHLTGARIKELPNSIGRLGALESLILTKCSNLEKLPEFQSNMERLKSLCLSGNAIKGLPSSICHLTGLTRLVLGESAIKDLPSSICHLTRLGSLDLRGCKNLTSLPKYIYKLKSLESCDINECPNLEVVPEIKEDMEHLEFLSLSGKGIKELPLSIKRLKGIKNLSLSNCENLESLPNSIGQLTCLQMLSLFCCPKLQKLPDALRSLKCCLSTLAIVGCNLTEGAIPSDLWCLSSLVSLTVSENNIRSIPNGIIELSQLINLRMNHCPMLEEIPKLPSSLRRMEAHDCPCLKTLSTDPTNLLWSNYVDCFKSLIQDITKGTFCIYWKDNIVPYGTKISVAIPGSCGIPEWVSHKSMGREIRVELPKNWYEDNNFLGFALFFYLIPLDYDNLCKMRNGSHYLPISFIEFGISNGDEFECLDIPVDNSHCKSYLNIDFGHETFTTSCLDSTLGVVYFPQISIITEYRSNWWNKIKARFEGPFGCGNTVAFNVESCGIHLIYHDHVEDHNQPRHKLSNIKRSHRDIEDHSQHKKSRQA